jgi:Competence protein CoiA-like family
MLFAKIDGVFRQPMETGERTTCTTCAGDLTGHHGDIRVWHWQHLSRGDCDTWADPAGETAWHLDWKRAALFTKQYDVEQTLRVNDEVHRADIRSKNERVVIEIQHSPLPSKEINRRTDFWARFGTVVWVFDQNFEARFRAWCRDVSKTPRGTALVLDLRASGRGLVTLDTDTREVTVSTLSPIARLTDLLTIHPPQPLQAVLSLARARAGSPETTGTTGTTASHPSYPSHTLEVDVSDSHSKILGTTGRMPTVIPMPDQPCGHRWEDGQRVWVDHQPTDEIRCRKCVSEIPVVTPDLSAETESVWGGSLLGIYHPE